MPRTTIPSVRIPVDLTNLGITHLWDFGTGFDGTKGAYVADMIGHKSVQFGGGSALANVFTTGSYFADLEAGSNDYFVQPVRFADSAITSFTASCWILPETLSGQMEFLSIWNGLNNQRTFAFEKASNRALRILMSSNGSGTTAIYTTDNTALIADGQLQFIAATYDGGTTTCKIYSNGVESSGTVTSGAVPSSLFSSTSAMSLGANFDGSGVVQQPFDGKIGMCTFARDKAMSAAEILTLYNMTGRMGNFI